MSNIALDQFVCVNCKSAKLKLITGKFRFNICIGYYQCEDCNRITKAYYHADRLMLGSKDCVKEPLTEEQKRNAQAVGEHLLENKQKEKR